MRKNNEEYKKIARENQDALDYPKVLQDHKLFLDSFFWVVIKNKYPYDFFDGYVVKEHYLIVPKDNNLKQPYEVKRAEMEELNAIIRRLYERMLGDDCEQIFVFVKLKGKSINKLHWHVVVC